MAENVPAEYFNPNYHYRYMENQYDKRRKKYYSYERIRPRVRLDATPLREMLHHKKDRFDSVEQMAWHLGMDERCVSRIYYHEVDATHIDNADRICMGFNTSLREVYGE